MTRLQWRCYRNLSSTDAIINVGKKLWCNVVGVGAFRRQPGKLPGEEAFEKGFYIKLGVWHDACIQEEVVQPVVPAAENQTQMCYTVVPNLNN